MKHLMSSALGTALLVATPAIADKSAVLNNYADIALAKYQDSLATAQTLLTTVYALIDMPSATAQQAAKSGWLASRVPYQQTEVYRFGNAIVDDWEGKVNAWPLDEGLIDYVDTSYDGATDENEYAVLNVIANPIAVQIHRKGSNDMCFGAIADCRRQRLAGQHMCAIQLAINHTIK